MIGGDICTRHCRFCNTLSGRPLPLDPDEPQRVAESVKEMNLRYVVLTSVDRDDLPDMGAEHWHRTIEAVRQRCQTKIEVLLPDFQGRDDLMDIVLESHPDVVAHNIETVRRLTPSVRSVATYDGSLHVLKHIHDSGFVTKSYSPLPGTYPSKPISRRRNSNGTTSRPCRWASALPSVAPSSVHPIRPVSGNAIDSKNISLF